MKTPRAFAPAVLALLTMMLTLFAAVPQQINYQGQLTSSTGSALDTTLGMTFKLYGDTTQPAIWTEAHSSVSVSKGLFNAALGVTTPLTDAILNNTQVWLGITVGGDAEMTPKTRIVSVGYAYRVGTVDGASGGTITSDVVINNRINVGSGNTNAGNFANIHGQNGVASGDHATVGGGQANHSSGSFSTVSGGLDNEASNSYAASGGGVSNIASGSASTVGGGDGCTAGGLNSTVGGGYFNSALGEQSAVAGGGQNYAPGIMATIAGGNSNVSTSHYSTVGGGSMNESGGLASTVSGGIGDSASANWATVGGGNNNSASGLYSTVSGGASNNATASFATVSGGAFNRASGQYSFAAGRLAMASNSGSFVWGSGGDTTLSFADNSITARAPGGVRIYTTVSATTVGVSLATSGGSWASLSDSTMKRRLGRVNTAEILQKVCSLPIEKWSYITQDEKIQHIGPMAQAFYNAFQVGDDNKTITTVDPDGVSLAAIQELAKENAELKDRLKQIETRLQSHIAGEQKTFNKGE